MLKDENPLDLQESTNLQLTPLMLGYLRSAARWSSFLGIIGFIGTGLMAVGGIFMMFAGGFLADQLGAAIGPVAIAMIYLAGAALYFFPSLYLFQFGRDTKQALTVGSEESLSKGLEALKSWFKFVGILVVIFLGLYALIFVTAIVGGLSNFF